MLTPPGQHPCGPVTVEASPEDPHAEHGATLAVAAQPRPAFNEADCGGAFDSFTVTSDADPGL